MFKTFTFVCLCVTIAYSSKAKLNELVDKALLDTRLSVIKQHREVVPLPDFDKVYPLGGKYVAGRLDCSEGWAKDLSTVRRTGDAVLTRAKNKLILVVALGLGNLQFGFDRCQLSIEPFFSVARNFSATVGRNSIHVQVSVVLNGMNECRPNLDSFHIFEAEEIQVHTGEGIIEEVKDKIFSALIMHFHDEVLAIVNQELADITRTQIANSTFC